MILNTSVHIVGGDLILDLEVFDDDDCLVYSGRGKADFDVYDLDTFREDADRAVSSALEKLKENMVRDIRAAEQRAEDIRRAWEMLNGA